MKNISIISNQKPNFIGIYSKMTILDCTKKLMLSTMKIYKEVAKKLNYIKCGDYYIPDVRLSKPNIRLGKWGQMRREYLRQTHPILFSDMVLTETLFEHCAEVEATAKSRMDLIVPQLMKHYGVTEQLKAENQMEWVRQMNACVAQAEETIKAELIYC